MRNSALEYVESTQRRKDLAEFRTGDTVRVNWKVKEGDKEREQAFEGVVIRKKKGGVSSSFTVRKVSYGVGVERIFPLHSPRYETIDVLQHGDVRRNRLFYLRALRGKASKVDQLEEQDEVVAAGAEGAAKAEKPAKAPKAPKAKAPKAPKAEAK
ncbi:MAG: 50S ribosomal protein L19 [Archangiaceae bacterium]|nr:50S ribosomal protein L19 [Archangiaceae bacterium]